MGFIFITLAAIHANGYGYGELLQALRERGEEGYAELQRREWQPGIDMPTRSHHLFSGVPWHHHVGDIYGGARLGGHVDEKLGHSKVV